MEGEKIIVLSPGPKDTQLSVSPDLALFLTRKFREIDELASTFKSRARRTAGSTSLEIVPPIPRNRLNTFGKALVELIKSIDDSPPGPTIEIRDTWNPDSRAV